jgi:hypothetical protein
MTETKPESAYTAGTFILSGSAGPSQPWQMPFFGAPSEVNGRIANEWKLVKLERWPHGRA